MKVRRKLLLAVMAALVAGSLALTGCTYESEKLDRPAGGSSDATFDVNSVEADPSLAEQVPTPIKNRGKIVVGSNTEYPPAEYVDSDNKPVGYDIDLITAVANKLGLKTDVKSTEFTSILPALGTKYDAGISSFTVTPERLVNVNMISILSVGTTWAVKKGNPNKVSLDDVCGLTIGVQTGTTQEDPDLSGRNAACRDQGKAPIDIVTLKNQTDITTRLINGSIDAMAADSPITGYAITQTNGQVEPVGDVYDTAPQAIVVAKDNLDWAGLIQKALQSLKDDGSYQALLKSWGAEKSEINDFQVNPEVQG